MKKALKSFLGKIFIFFQPKKALQLSKMGMTLSVNNGLSLKNRLIRSELLSRAERIGDHETLAKFHNNFWVEKGHDFFSNNERSVLDGYFLPHCSYLIDELKKKLNEQSVNFKTMLEIGTGHGDVLNYLSSEFPKIRSFVGIDLSLDQINSNKEKYRENRRLKFEASDGLEWIMEHGESNMIVITSGGVLEYFTENRLKLLFDYLNNLGPTIFLAIEPIGIDIDFSIDPTSRPYGSERSFSHDYERLFKESGFKIWHQSKLPYKAKDHDFFAFCAISQISFQQIGNH